MPWFPTTWFPQPGGAGTKVHYRLRRAGMLLLQGFAPHPTHYAAKFLRMKGRFRRVVLQTTALCGNKPLSGVVSGVDSPVTT